MRGIELTFAMCFVLVESLEALKTGSDLVWKPGNRTGSQRVGERACEKEEQCKDSWEKHFGGL